MQSWFYFSDVFKINLGIFKFKVVYVESIEMLKQLNFQKYLPTISISMRKKGKGDLKWKKSE